MIPNRLAIALQDDGWWVRSEIIWHKPNPMPESVYDRPTSAHEKVWLLTKSEDYFYNHEAIREPVTGGAHVRAAARGTDTGVGWGRLDRLDPDQPDRGARSGEAARPELEAERRPGAGVAEARPARQRHEEQREHGRRARRTEPQPALNPQRSDVWTIAPRAYREAHFATFPPALAERCIRAGVPVQSCGLCGHALPASDMRGTVPVHPAGRRQGCSTPSAAPARSGSSPKPLARRNADRAQPRICGDVRAPDRPCSRDRRRAGTARRGRGVGPMAIRSEVLRAMLAAGRPPRCSSLPSRPRSAQSPPRSMRRRKSAGPRPPRGSAATVKRTVTQVTAVTRYPQTLPLMVAPSPHPLHPSPHP